MKKGKTLGLYLGERFVTAALVDNTNLVAFTRCNLSSAVEDGDAEMLSEDVLWEAAINKSLREIKAESKDIFISLADKDFIFRCFEMPLMNKKEIETSLGFELEKFIPFKIEDLIWDYRYTKVSNEKKINLSFLGIKKNIYKKYRDLLTRLDINILNI